MDAEMVQSVAGTIAESSWYEIPQHYPDVDLDAFVVMPNHVHGILVLTEESWFQVRIRACHQCI